MTYVMVVLLEPEVVFNCWSTAGNVTNNMLICFSVMIHFLWQRHYIRHVFDTCVMRGVHSTAKECNL